MEKQKQHPQYKPGDQARLVFKSKKQGFERPPEVVTVKRISATSVSVIRHVGTAREQVKHFPVGNVVPL